MKPLIVGGLGYIGVNLKKALKDVEVYDLKQGQDILKPYQLEPYIRGASEVYHLAAIPGVKQCEDEPCNAFLANVYGAFNVSRLCWKHGKSLVFASSFAVTSGENTLYGFTKRLAEECVLRYGGTVCRLSNVYGGVGYVELKDSVIARLLKNTFEERGHGNVSRDFIHVEDVCKKLVASMGHGGVVEVCSGKRITLNELVEFSKEDGFPDNLRYFSYR